MDPTATRSPGFVFVERSRWEIFKWLIARIMLFRWLTGCGGQGFTKDANSSVHPCHRLGCH